MMAFAGWVTVDAGITFPGEQYEGIKSLEAHDIAVSNGAPRHARATHPTPAPSALLKLARPGAIFLCRTEKSASSASEACLEPPSDVRCRRSVAATGVDRRCGSQGCWLRVTARRGALRIAGSCTALTGAAALPQARCGACC